MSDDIIIRPMTEEDLAELERAENVPGARIDKSLIPHALMHGLQEYVNIGRPVGSFLEYTLCNNMMRAVGQADPYSRVALPSIVAYIYNDMPSECHGSKECYDAWLNMHAVVREHGEDSDQAREAWKRCVEAKRRARQWEIGQIPWPKDEEEE